jgi:hypothetical protein
MALFLTACAPGQDTPTPTTDVNVSRYLAVGDTYTAGISAGGLTSAGQRYSFPNLLAQQFQGSKPDAAFSQPLIEGTGSGYLNVLDIAPVGYVRTRRVAGQAVRGTVVNPNACGGADTVRLLTRSATSATLPQNLGIPGLLLSQITTANLGNQSNATPGGAFNPYFERLLPASDNRTYLQAVTTAASSATFFTFFQGLDDLMPYIRSGGTCGSVGNTFVNQMKTNAKRVLDVLTAGGRPGIIAKLPDVTTLPLLSLGKGDQLEARLRATFGDTASLYVATPSGEGRRISARDYVLATAIPRIGQPTAVQVGGNTVMLPYGRNIRNPVRNADVLDAEIEMTLLVAAVNNYNNADPTSNPSAVIIPGLEYLAKTYNMPVISSSTSERTLNVNNVLFGQVNDLISVAGVQYSPEPVRGNFFSPDYYSLTPRGNGLLANAFISAINRAYRTNLPAIDVNTLPTSAQ